MRVAGLLLIFAGGTLLYWAYTNATGSPYGKNAGQPPKSKTGSAAQQAAGTAAASVLGPFGSFVSQAPLPWDTIGNAASNSIPGGTGYFQGVADWVRNRSWP